MCLGSFHRIWMSNDPAFVEKTAFFPSYHLCSFVKDTWATFVQSAVLLYPSVCLFSAKTTSSSPLWLTADPNVERCQGSSSVLQCRVGSCVCSLFHVCLRTGLSLTHPGLLTATAPSLPQTRWEALTIPSFPFHEQGTFLRLFRSALVVFRLVLRFSTQRFCTYYFRVKPKLFNSGC